MRSSRSTCSACRSSASASSRATPTAATASAAPARGRSSPAARRCAPPPSAPSSTRRRSPAKRSKPRAGDIEYRAGRFAVVGTDLGIDLFALAGKQPAAASTSMSSSHRRRSDLAERLPRLRGRGRSGDRRRRRRRLRVGERHRPRRQPDDRARPGRRRRGAGPRPGALRAGRLRRRQRPARSPAASWTTPCRAPTIGVSFRTDFDTSIPCALNPLGVKGVGELGTIGATPAVINAVVDALDHAGLGRAAEQIEMPATPERVWRLLAGVRDAPGR